MAGGMMTKPRLHRVRHLGNGWVQLDARFTFHWDNSMDQRPGEPLIVITFPPQRWLHEQRMTTMQLLPTETLLFSTSSGAAMDTTTGEIRFHFEFDSAKLDKPKLLGILPMIHALQGDFVNIYTADHQTQGIQPAAFSAAMHKS
jgi:hypothetical protein